LIITGEGFDRRYFSDWIDEKACQMKLIMEGLAMPNYRGTRYYRETDEKPNITKALIFRIFSYFKPYWKIMAVMFLTILLTSGLGVIPSLINKSIIDDALPKDQAVLNKDILQPEEKAVNHSHYSLIHNPS
jgi:hypothetical protein